jgi:surfactin synthase thioesterase subunit
MSDEVSPVFELSTAFRVIFETVTPLEDSEEAFIFNGSCLGNLMTFELIKNKMSRFWGEWKSSMISRRACSLLF